MRCEVLLDRELGSQATVIIFTHAIVHDDFHIVLTDGKFHSTAMFVVQAYTNFSYSQRTQLSILRKAACFAIKRVFENY
jgi:hypothetical protein